MNDKTIMYQLTETGSFCMSFVIITKEDNAIVIDGGDVPDMPLLKEYVGNRKIKAWILTHAHSDHIGGFNYLAANDEIDNVEKVYYNFPRYNFVEKYEPQDAHTLLDFNNIIDKLRGRTGIPIKGTVITIDEVTIEFLYHHDEKDNLIYNALNDSSLVFMLKTPNKKVLFLGDLGPEGGDLLYYNSRDKLKCDIVQMAHHGHMCCGPEIYISADPSACLWCCPDWLYNEPADPDYMKYQPYRNRLRMYGTLVTRQWMDKIGIKTHYVTMNGTNKIEL